MKIEKTDLKDVFVIEPKIYNDERGFFLESWNEEKYSAAGLDVSFVQDNHSRSTQGVLRGLHYQVKHAQGKLVRVTKGTIFDVAVDVRPNSTTYLKWVGITLSEHNQKQMWVPPGFAHGFYVLSEVADMQYKCTDYYAPEHEVSIRWDDPSIGIKWPILEGTKPVISDKDQNCPLIS